MWRLKFLSIVERPSSSLALGDVVSVCFCTSLPLGSQSSGIERKLNATRMKSLVCMLFVYSPWAQHAPASSPPCVLSNHKGSGIPVRLHFLVFRSNVAKHTYSAKISSLALDLENFGSFGHGGRGCKQRSMSSKKRLCVRVQGGAVLFLPFALAPGPAASR